MPRLETIRDNNESDDHQPDDRADDEREPYENLVLVLRHRLTDTLLNAVRDVRKSAHVVRASIIARFSIHL